MRLPLHHPSEATMLSYAAGALDRGSIVVIDHHLASCTGCSDLVRLGNSIGGVLAAEQPSAQLPARGVEDLLWRIDQAPKAPEPPPEPLDLRPVGLRRAAPTQAFRFRRLWQEGDHTLQLVQLEPGSAAPLHRHDGLELMLVLAGAFNDGRNLYEVGDVCEADPGVEHEPRAVGDTPCLCLIALEGPLLYRSVFHRIRRRFFGI